MSDSLLLGLDNNYVSQRTEKLDTLTTSFMNVLYLLHKVKTSFHQIHQLFHKAALQLFVFPEEVESDASHGGVSAASSCSLQVNTGKGQLLLLNFSPQKNKKI